MIVRHMGESIALWKLVKHYRDMARWFPRSRTLYRRLTKTVIAQYREQSRG